MKLVTANDLHIPREHKLVAYGWVISILTIWFFTASRF